MADARKRPTRGFTLIELAMVMVIIGILISFILVAARSGVQRAEERATQSLLLKLDTGIADRIEALLSASGEPSAGHQVIARVFYDSSDTDKWIPGPQRAQAIEQHDTGCAELPDVFLVVPPSGTGGYAATDYPLNFAANVFPVDTSGISGITAAQTSAAQYVLPLGHLDKATAFDGGTGIYGASYTAAAGIYKNLGYLPTGYDGVDNNLNGLVDEYGEGVTTGTGGNAATVLARLAAHTHKTARAEMLYAILVEGQGPLGSVFAADEFTDREVRDTDGDGLPEFIDAWGEPLQFYRWPIFYHSDLQKGLILRDTDDDGVYETFPPYNGPIEAREQDPLDPNQQLVAPAWWSSTTNAGTAPLSNGARTFQAHFHSLVEPLSSGGPSSTQSFWSRGTTASSFHQRRAYFSKFLIVSSGPDQELGIAQVGEDYGVSPAPSTPFNDAANLNVVNLLIENQAAQATLNRTDAVYLTPQTDAGNGRITSQLQESGLDDITNHTMLSAGGGVQ